MENKPLLNKVAVITGASHGLGKSVAGCLATLGASIVLIARNQDRLDAVANEIVADNAGQKVLALTCDVSDQEMVLQTASTITSMLGCVDILVNNAGIPAPRTFEETSLSDWDEVIGTNLSGVFYMTRALWDTLIASVAGYVITISGTSGLRGGGSPAYGSAKYGLTGLNHAIAAAGKDHGLRATILYPGGMDTGWRGAPIGIKPKTESMDPKDVANFIGQLVTSPPEFVVSEAVLNPLTEPFM